MCNGGYIQYNLSHMLIWRPIKLFLKFSCPCHSADCICQSLVWEFRWNIFITKFGISKLIAAAKERPNLSSIHPQNNPKLPDVMPSKQVYKSFAKYLSHPTYCLTALGHLQKVESLLIIVSLDCYSDDDISNFQGSPPPVTLLKCSSEYSFARHMFIEAIITDGVLCSTDFFF